MAINETAKMTAATGEILTPIDESSKNLMRPAPDEGIGALPERLLLLLDLPDILFSNIFYYYM
jgi:hypothetical protein